MKRALLVGINEYPDKINVLDACLNDVIDFNEFLVKKCKFPFKQVKKLTERRAPRKAIIKGLKSLIKNSYKGDIAVFFYSGHGNRVPVKNRRGYVDKYYESICPFDFNWSGKNNISDSFLDKQFSKIRKGVKFIWISDSCFSSGLYDYEKPVNKKRGGRRFHEPSKIRKLAKAASDSNIKPMTMKTAADLNCVVLISAARERQMAEEKDFKNEIRLNGLLTYYLLEELNKKNGLKIPMNKLVTLTAEKTMYYGKTSKPSFTQKPAIYGKDELINKSFLR